MANVQAIVIVLLITLNLAVFAVLGYAIRGTPMELNIAAAGPIHFYSFGIIAALLGAVSMLALSRVVDPIIPYPALFTAVAVAGCVLGMGDIFPIAVPIAVALAHFVIGELGIGLLIVILLKADG